MSRKRKGHWGSKGVKVRYQNRDNAVDTARKLRVTECINFEVYECQVCEFFHVGSRPWPHVSIEDRHHRDFYINVELGDRAAMDLFDENMRGERWRYGKITSRWKPIFRKFNLPVRRTGWEFTRWERHDRSA